MLRRVFPPFLGGPAAVGLLAVRLFAGAAMMVHGWPKVQHPFSWMNPNDHVPGIFQGLATLAEFGGGFCWIVGLLTPLASLLILGDMVVAIATVHIPRGHPFVSQHSAPASEAAVGYLAIAILLLLAGCGKLSLDWPLFGRRRAADKPVA